MKLFYFLLFVSCVLLACSKPKNAIVIQTDFGLKDGAVNAMKGVAHSVDAELQMFDLTHEIPAYNVWEASYRLYQSAPFWPAGTVFVSVVDPGVGTERKSIVLKTKTGQYFVTPDNGTLTLVADELGIEAVRIIDEKINRRLGSDSSYTFHGRDVYVYTAARLASGKISFEDVGPLAKDSIVHLDYQKVEFENGILRGNIPILDVQYGNVWSNIPDSLFRSLGAKYGDLLQVNIFNLDSSVKSMELPYLKTFGDVPEGKPLGYMNSLGNFSVALNMGNFADSFQIKSGKDWRIEITKKSK